MYIAIYLSPFIENHSVIDILRTDYPTELQLKILILIGTPGIHEIMVTILYMILSKGA